VAPGGTGSSNPSSSSGESTMNRCTHEARIATVAAGRCLFPRQWFGSSTFPERDRRFESGSLQRGVSANLVFGANSIDDHLKSAALLLYDVTSTYLEGRCCELAQHGYSRDHRSDRPQIVIGLMSRADGCPVAVEVFEGNTADPLTLSAQIDKLKQRFHLQRVVKKRS
jgi:hypothetical protein